MKLVQRFAARCLYTPISMRLVGKVWEILDKFKDFPPDDSALPSACACSEKHGKCEINTKKG